MPNHDPNALPSLDDARTYAVPDNEDAAVKPRSRKWVRKLLLVVVGGFLLYQLHFLVLIAWYKSHNPRASAFMRHTISELRRDNPAAAITHQWVPYADISAALKRAVITSEDANFMTHPGVEWDAIRAAADYNRKQASLGSDKRRGGSTISQQLAKNLFLSSERSYWRKGQELILTYMLEALLSKERILEMYLNVAQWGQATFGAEAAARHYFRVSAKQLTNHQAARLAAMLPNPRFYDKNRSTSYLNSRTASIQRRLHHVAIP
ncbi:MAG TPA: monofunctional biosynthetic peptidoglycan transglycosylase [Candidatus Paenalcaligenes intestinipullorum]|uniref:Biosynthetic peptidoglycan transglycosylase n=1 Tax=Candidatus Paenalcaligenes intestinipullorum TaxID=2838718 RepID=A0A9D2U7E3_9BURK|nr:monofunctional biosynthetic peptidoglycan transglycosylase [Candidatus Paenalcaligenes intestinipullorum]